MVAQGHPVRVASGAAGAQEGAVFINHVAKQVRNVGKAFITVGTAVC